MRGEWVESARLVMNVSKRSVWTSCLAYNGGNEGVMVCLI